MMKKKFFAIAMVIMMVLSLLPVQVFATEAPLTLYVVNTESEFLSKNDGIGLTQLEGSVKLGKDVTKVPGFEIKKIYLKTIEGNEDLSLATLDDYSVKRKRSGNRVCRGTQCSDKDYP